MLWPHEFVCFALAPWRQLDSSWWLRTWPLGISGTFVRWGLGIVVLLACSVACSFAIRLQWHLVGYDSADRRIWSWRGNELLSHWNWRAIDGVPEGQSSSIVYYEKGLLELRLGESPPGELANKRQVYLDKRTIEWPRGIDIARTMALAIIPYCAIIAVVMLVPPWGLALCSNPASSMRFVGLWQRQVAQALPLVMPLHAAWLLVVGMYDTLAYHSTCYIGWRSVGIDVMMPVLLFQLLTVRGAMIDRSRVLFVSVRCAVVLICAGIAGTIGTMVILSSAIERLYSWC